MITDKLSLLLLGDAECSGNERVSVHGGDGAEGSPDPIDDHVLHVGVPTAALWNQGECLTCLLIRTRKEQIPATFPDPELTPENYLTNVFSISESNFP